MTTVRRRVTDVRADTTAGDVLTGGLGYVKEISGLTYEQLVDSSKPPTEEIGVPGFVSNLPWSQMWLGDPLETVPQLQWPQSVWTYSAMGNDSQIDGLHAGSTLPIRRYRWYIDPNGCDPKQAEVLSSDLNIPIEGLEEKPRKRMRNRFNHDKFMFHSFKALAFGFYFFEIVGEVTEDGLWHLRKMAPRPPLTIMNIDLDHHGELVAVRQNITMPGIPLQPIPATSLVSMVWDQEGANYTGRSMLRSLYRNWLIKDRLLRVDALKHERNGMGVPIAEGFQGAGKEDLQALNMTAQRLKAGDVSGAAIPFGAKITLQGVQGSLPDTIASINYHDEQMSRRYLMMFIQLASTLHGSRSLGSEFIDYFALAQESLANWYRDTVNEQFIESYWTWNYGETDSVPLLKYKRNDDPRLAFEDLHKMVESGIVRVDDELEESVREVMELPRFKGPAREALKPPMMSPQDVNIPAAGETAPAPTQTQPEPAEPPGAAKAGRRKERTFAARFARAFAATPTNKEFK